MANAARKEQFNDSSQSNSVGDNYSPFAANDPRYDQGKKKKSFLKGALKSAFKMAVGVGAGVALGYGTSLLMDPWFFSPVHDPNNEIARGIENMMSHFFGWVHDAVGLTGNGGFMRSDFVMDTLGFREWIPETPLSKAQEYIAPVSASDIADKVDGVDSVTDFVEGMVLE